MKVCRTCKQYKQLKEFYKHSQMLDGHLNICKKCVKIRVTKYRKLNHAKIINYDRWRHRVENMSSEQLEKRRKRSRLENMTTEQIKIKRLSGRVENKPSKKIKLKNYFSRKFKVKQSDWRKKNPKKYKAYLKVCAYYGNKKKSLKPQICSQCGKRNCRIEGHHKDYSKPLEVIWLCKRCHSKLHRIPNHLLGVYVKTGG